MKHMVIFDDLVVHEYWVKLYLSDAPFQLLIKGTTPGVVKIVHDDEA